MAARLGMDYAPGGRKVSTGRAAVSAWERGRRTPPVQYLQAYVDIGGDPIILTLPPGIRSGGRAIEVPVAEATDGSEPNPAATAGAAVASGPLHRRGRGWWLAFLTIVAVAASAPRSLSLHSAAGLKDPCQRGLRRRARRPTPGQTPPSSQARGRHSARGSQCRYCAAYGATSSWTEILGGTALRPRRGAATTTPRLTPSTTTEPPAALLMTASSSTSRSPCAEEECLSTHVMFALRTFPRGALSRSGWGGG